MKLAEYDKAAPIVAQLRVASARVAVIRKSLTEIESCSCENGIEDAGVEMVLSGSERSLAIEPEWMPYLLRDVIARYDAMITELEIALADVGVTTKPKGEQ